MNTLLSIIEGTLSFIGLVALSALSIFWYGLIILIIVASFPWSLVVLMFLK